MAYTPTQWETADIVTATRMNALETAVGDMNMSYTPNTWSDGDVLTAAKMNALEQAVASGGGGGSSDFSTAEVTFIDTFDGQSRGYYVLLPTIQNDVIECIYVSVSYGNPATVTLPLYKGEFVFPLEAFTSINEDADPTASGDVDVDFSQGPPSFIVTGDGTVSWESQEIF